MEVNEELVDKLANLAKLRFADEEKEAITNDLQRMISFVQKMDEVDTNAVEPILHMSNSTNIFRADEIGDQVDKKEALKNAAGHNEDFFLVPKVIKK
jgi:aspartyl-tRNA(Asn)/glutamyl-tRNA(Gln) amidotransferase subunit C